MMTHNNVTPLFRQFKDYGPMAIDLPDEHEPAPPSGFYTADEMAFGVFLGIFIGMIGTVAAAWAWAGFPL